MNKKATKSNPISTTRSAQTVAEDASYRNYMIICGVTIALVVAIGGYAIFYLIGRYTFQSNVNKAQDKLVASLEANVKNLGELAPNYDAINTKGANGISDAELILRAMPTTQDYENLIATLEKIGQDSGVKVTNVSQSTNEAAVTAAATTSGAAAVPFTFTVNVEGSYSAMLDFLKKTENSARIINFNSMSLNGSTGTISASLTMTTFFKPDANINSTFVPLQ